VDFENFSNSLIYTNSVHNGSATGLISGPQGTYYFMLLSAETNTTTIDATLGGGRNLDDGGWSPEIRGQNTGTPGLMNGNDDPIGPGATTSVPDSTPANFAVVGWSANIGPNWSDALAWWNNGNPNSGPSGWFGISSVAQDVLVRDEFEGPPTIFGPTPGYEIQGFTLNLYTIPEPSTWALVVSSLSAMYALRRRQGLKRF
jgi:hypothetical protein